MPSWPGIIALVEPILLLFLAIGGYIGLKSGLAKAATEVQERVRAALHDENELLRNQVKRLENENKRLDGLMLLIVTALKKTRGIELEVDDDIVTLRDASGTHVSRLVNGQTP